MAFVRFFPTDGEWSVFVKETRSGNERKLYGCRLPRSIFRSGFPAWSPDGRQIALDEQTSEQHNASALLIGDVMDPLIVNVHGPRYGALMGNDRRVIGFNNIELISDRPLQTNLDEIRRVKRNWPDRAVVVSLMVPCEEAAWKRILPMVEDTGCDGVELNFGCPHGMSERGMGAAMGQVPEYTCMVTEWVKEVSDIPVIVNLTPNVTHIVPPGKAAQNGGADAVSLINTINSVMGVDVDTLIPYPNVNGMAAHGGYCGTAVKPIALNMVSELARDSEFTIPISGIGGINTWRDAVEFMLLGEGNVQVCTAVMHYGYRIVEDMIDGLNNSLDSKGYASVNDDCWQIGEPRDRLG